MKWSFNNKTCSSGSNCKHNKDDLALDSRPKLISDTPLRLVHCGLRLGPMEYVSWYFFSKTISPKILAKRKKKSPVSTWLMLWTEVHMHLNCDSHVLLLSASFRETRRPGRFWPEQGTPAASVREVQSPGLLLPPRAIRRIPRLSPPFPIVSPTKRSKKWKVPKCSCKYL